MSNEPIPPYLSPPVPAEWREAERLMDIADRWSAVVRLSNVVFVLMIFGLLGVWATLSRDVTLVTCVVFGLVGITNVAVGAYAIGAARRAHDRAGVLLGELPRD